MLCEAFYWIFNMSIASSITGVLIMLIRLVKRIPRRITVFLWIIPFARMVFPLGLNSPYGLMALISKITTRTVVVFQPYDKVAFSATNYIMVADSYFPITYKVSILEKVFGVASVIWIVVALAILLMMFFTYFSTMHEIKDSRLLADNVYLSDKVISPAVYGIIKPKIILPATYKDMELVILHEKIHIQKFDNLWRIVAFTVVSVHWFNPFSWLFLREFLADTELSCDECVLKKIGSDRAKEYASSLLKNRQGTTVFASAFGGAKTRTRIENILSFKKMTLFSFSVFTVLICTVFYALLTNAG